MAASSTGEKIRKAITGIAHATYLLNEVTSATDPRRPKLSNEIKDAYEFIADCMKGITKVGAERRRCVEAKEAIIGLAMELDPACAGCIEMLSFLSTRTLAYFAFSCGQSTPQPVQSALRNASKFDYSIALPEMDHEINESTNMFLRITNLCIAAHGQSSQAILDLLCLAINDHMHESALHHLFRDIQSKCADVQSKDEAQRKQTKRACTFTANWPEPPAKPEVYASILREVHAGFERLDTKPSPRAGANPFQRYLEKWLSMVDEAFVEEQKIDKLSNLTPVFLEALTVLCRNRLLDFLIPEAALYGVGAEEQHFADRRNWALKVCALARRGHAQALRLMVDKLLVDKHWMIRQTVVVEACSTLGHGVDLLVHQPTLLHSLIDKVVQLVFSLPYLEDPPEIQQQRKTVREAAEAALIAEVAQMDSRISSMIVGELQEFCFRNNESMDWNQPIYTRVIAAVPSRTGPSLSGGHRGSSMRKERERQARMDAAYPARR